MIGYRLETLSLALVESLIQCLEQFIFTWNSTWAKHFLNPVPEMEMIVIID